MSEHDPDQLDAVEAATRLEAAYSWHLDQRDEAAWIGLFAEGGVLRIGPDRIVTGRDGLARFVQGTPRGVHVPGVPHVEVVDGGVYARSSLVFVDADTGLIRAVLNDTRLAWEGPELRIVHRRIDIRADTGSVTA